MSDDANFAAARRSRAIRCVSGLAAAAIATVLGAAAAQTSINTQGLAQTPGGPVFATAIPGVVAAGSPVVFIKGGLTSSEGPVAGPDGSVYFTEPTVNKVYKVDPTDAVTLFFDAQKVDDPKGERWRMPSLGMNSKGELLAARRAATKFGIAIIYPADKAKFLAEAYNGTPFAAPNDMSVAKNDSIYFTDQGSPEQGAKSTRGMFYLKPSGEVILATDQIASPNGLALSRDEKTMYAVDSKAEYVYAFDVQSDGTLKNRRNFATLKGIKKTDKGIDPGVDGVAIDNDGRLYVITHAGIEVFSETGKALGVIPMPIKVQNLAFGGKDGKTLYVVGRGNLFKVSMISQKFTGRAK
jgi:gluconolactonase